MAPDSPADAGDADASVGGGSSTSSFKVYTRTGDGGTSCLFNMERRDKDDVAFEALGDVDELGVAVGLAEANALAEVARNPTAVARADLERLSKRLREIQSRLLDVGSAVATPLAGDASSEWKKSRAAFSDSHVDALESWIDEYDESLPPLKTFILPGGGIVAAHLHHARVVARRAERRCVPMVRAEDCPPEVTKYLNRLSDFLYTAARFAAMRTGEEETPYRKPD